MSTSGATPSSSRARARSCCRRPISTRAAPGYNKRHRDGGELPETYDYTLDVRDSIRADKNVRDGMRAAGLTFVPDRDAAWYGFPAERPPKEHPE